MMRWLYGAGIALSLVILVTVMATTDWLGFKIMDLFAADYNISCNNTAITESIYTTSDNLTFQDGGDGICILDEALSVGSVVIQNGATITHTGQDPDGVNITTTGNLTINVGGAVNADSRGCISSIISNTDGYGPNGSNVCTQSTAGFSPATGGSSSGAGHAGLGGNSYNSIYLGAVYDNPTAPSLFGSSAANISGGDRKGGTGGGKIFLNVGGVFTNNGSVSASGGTGGYDGNGYGAGGGSGGAIYIIADTISDGGNTEGTFSAVGGGGSGYPVNGYTGDGGGGGGGMIALVYDANDGTNPFDFNASDFNVSGGAERSRLYREPLLFK
jgi:hypothetical protein